MSDAATEDAAIDTDGDLTLVVARRLARNRLRGFRVPIHKEVEDDLRKACKATVTALTERQAIPYAGDADIDTSAQYLLVPNDVLVVAAEEDPDGGKHPRRRQFDPAVEATPGVVETDPQAHALLRAASSLNQIHAQDLGSRGFLLSAAVVGDDPAKRTSFIARHNPYRVADRGRIVTFFGDRLRRTSDPLLIFQPVFDIVVAPGQIAVLNPDAFDQVFRDIETMQERVPAWSRHVANALPTAAGTDEVIAAACRRNSRVARKARALYERGILKDRKITANELRLEMEKQGLPVDRLILADELVLEESDVPTVLKLLDEGLWTGWLTSTPWEAGTKSKRPM